MRRIRLAGILLAASLFVANLGAGVAPAAAQDIVVTEAHIAHLKHVLRLTPSQQRHWRSLEAALRAVAHRRTAAQSRTGLVQRVRARLSGYVVDAAAAHAGCCGRPAVDRFARPKPEERRSRCCAGHGGQCVVLEHDPEKWTPVFGKDHALT